VRSILLLVQRDAEGTWWQAARESDDTDWGLVSSLSHTRGFRLICYRGGGRQGRSRMAPAAQSLALAVLLLAPAVSAFYLPGVAPQDYARVRLPETPRHPNAAAWLAASRDAQTVRRIAVLRAPPRTPP